LIFCEFCFGIENFVYICAIKTCKKMASTTDTIMAIRISASGIIAGVAGGCETEKQRKKWQ
jgi:hypothetical protein